MNLENLFELHVKGELSEKGLLKESYSEEKDDLIHELTRTGKEQVKELLRDPKYQKEFLKMALEEAKNNPQIARELIKNAIGILK
jgi:predicted transcriptional regulator